MRKNVSFARAVATCVGAVAALALILCCAGCSAGTAASSSASASASSSAAQSAASSIESVDPVQVNAASLKGPTSIGLVSFMAQAEANETHNSFNFSIAGTADEILPGLINGSVDIALIPANAASVVYNKTSGGVQVIDVNTLGVLYVVTGDTSVNSISDLAGKTVVMTGKGTTPECVMNYLLDKAGIASQVTLEFKSEATEVAAVLANDASTIAVLPEPYVTSVCAQNAEVSARVSLTSEWDALQTGSAGAGTSASASSASASSAASAASAASASAGESEGQLVTGVTVVRSEFLQEHPQAVAEFLQGQQQSVATVNEDPASAASLVVEYGIIQKEALAQKAIPNCNLVCLTGDTMKNALSGYLEVLYNQDASLIGGALPSSDFYVTEF